MQLGTQRQQQARGRRKKSCAEKRESKRKKGTGSSQVQHCANVAHFCITRSFALCTLHYVLRPLGGQGLGTDRAAERGLPHWRATRDQPTRRPLPSGAQEKAREEIGSETAAAKEKGCCWACRILTKAAATPGASVKSRCVVQQVVRHGTQSRMSEAQQGAAGKRRTPRESDIWQLQKGCLWNSVTNTKKKLGERERKREICINNASTEFG